MIKILFKLNFAAFFIDVFIYQSIDYIVIQLTVLVYQAREYSC